jgi:hypothetical protein
MLRRFAIAAIILSCFIADGWGQSPSATAPSAPAPANPVAKKPAPKPKAAAKPATAADSGPCQIGVITAVGDVFAVQKVGLTVFGNEYTEVPVSWGLEDTIFARTRAAAGGISIRRIAYAKGIFDSYYHPQPSLFRNERQELTDLVRQIAGDAGCERYFVFTRLKGQLQGTNQTLEGIGVLNWGVGLLNTTSLFANLSLQVFDGQTFEIRKAPMDLDAVMTRMVASLKGDPSLHKIDDSAFPTSPEDAAKSAVLRDGTRNLLTERLDKFLPAYFKE